MLKKLSVHAIPGLCTLNIFEYEISLSCRKFRNHHQEPLFGHGNTFDRGRPVVLPLRDCVVRVNLNFCSFIDFFMMHYASHIMMEK
jgi:hypothetical protein